MFHVTFNCYGCPVVSMLVAYQVDSGVRIKVNIKNSGLLLACLLPSPRCALPRSPNSTEK